MNVAVVIPAYKPGSLLVDLVRQLVERGFPHIVVVDDGSGQEYKPLFQTLRANPHVRVITHFVNLGKGAALKTGINSAFAELPAIAGVVTADADGQHHPDDIAGVAQQLEQHPNALVIGARQFSGVVPLRSKAGNQLTRLAMRLLVGQSLADTQTGLRGIPRHLVPPILKIPANGYEFELDVLLACKYLSCPMVQHPIRTIYEAGNPTSHFNPLLDSLRIYFVLLRFTAVAITTALVDNLVFYFAYRATTDLPVSQVAARLCALGFNYLAIRNTVFLSKVRHRSVFPRYLAVVILSGTVSYSLIQAFSTVFTSSVMQAKVLAEALLFLVNFAVLRDFVFTRSSPEEATATDWDRYYQSVPSTARLTRKYTTRTLLRTFEQYAPARPQGLSIVELGGANSCFYDHISRHLPVSEYHVVDNNRFGLGLLKSRPDCKAILHEADVRSLALPVRGDIVFSVGLIEHFDGTGTQQAIEAHFKLVKDDGLIVITYPTPTSLYRAVRYLIEALGKWKFADERPLLLDEVAKSVQRCQGRILKQLTLWPLMLTQQLIVARPGASSDSAPVTPSATVRSPRNLGQPRCGQSQSSGRGLSVQSRDSRSRLA